jgi:hypothetical protein
MSFAIAWRRRLAVATCTVATYGALLAWLTWPLAARLATHLPATLVPCRTDIPYITWTLAYQSHALTTAPTTVLDANIYWPARHALLYGETGLAALPLFLPVFVATGNPTLAINLVFFGCLALTLASLHLVVARWTSSHLAGLVAAWTFLMNPWTLWLFLPWAPSYSVLMFFPLIILLAATPARRWRSALLLLPLVVLQCLANVVYLAAAVIGPLTLLALSRIARPSVRGAGARLLGVIVVAVTILSPVYVAYLRTRGGNPVIREQSVYQARAEAFDPRLRGMLVRVGNLDYGASILPGVIVGNGGPNAVSYTAFLLVIAGVLSVALRRASRRAARTAWAAAAFWVVAGFLASTPAVRFGDGPLLPLPPFALLGWLAPSLLENVREPSRLGIGGFLGLTMLAGLSFAECARRLPVAPRLPPAAAPLALAAAVAAGMYLEYRPFTRPEYPLAPAITGDSAVVRTLRQGRGPVLELPLGRGGLQPYYHATAMYRSIFHWRPLLNGYSSFWPAGFPERMALAQRLPDPVALEALRAETGLTTLVVRLAMLLPAERAAWMAAAGGSAGDLLRLVIRDGDDLVFEVGAPGGSPPSVGPSTRPPARAG